MLGFIVPKLQEKRLDVEYYKAHGCKIEGEMVLVPMRCPHLTEDNKCDIHDRKPFLCKQFKGKASKKKFWCPPECTYEPHNFVEDNKPMEDTFQ